MSTQKWDPDHKRKMVGGVLAAALLFSVVIGSKLNTGQLAAQVAGDEPGGCYYKLVDSTGAEVNAWLAWCDDTGCYYPDGYWDSPAGTYRLETTPNDPTSIVGSDGQKYIPSDVRSAYEVMEGDLCRDQNGIAYEDYDDGDDEWVDDGDDEWVDESENCWEEDRGDQICSVCTQGEEQWENCWQKDMGDDGKADPKDAARQLKDMQSQLNEHLKFNLPEYKRFLSGGDFKDYSGKVHKNPGRLSMVRENLNRDLKRNTKLAEMLTKAGIPTAELDLDIAWTKDRLIDIDLIEAELKVLIPKYEAAVQAVKSSIEGLNPENMTWNELDQAWFQLQKELEPYWSVRDGIDVVINFNERGNEISDWIFEYRKFLLDLNKSGAGAYADEQLLAELEEIARESVEVKNVAVEAVKWYKGSKSLADEVWTTVEFVDGWHEQFAPMRDRQQELNWWRNDTNRIFDDWRCVEEGGGDFGGFGGDFEDDFDDFGDDFDEEFGDFDDDFGDFGGGPGFCEMDVWRFLDEIRMTLERGREAGGHIDEIKFMIEAVGQMSELRSMIDTDDPKVKNAIDQLVKLAGEILPTMEEILAHMEAGEFEKAEKKGRQIDEVGGKAEKWAQIIMDYCNENSSRCELTPEVEELIYGGPGDFEGGGPGDHRDYLGQVYIDEDLIEKIVNELLSKFAEDFANQLVQQFAKSFSEAEMNKLITAMIDEAIEKTMSTVFNYFDAYGDEKSKVLVENSSAVYEVISKIEGLGDVDNAVKKLLAQIKEKPVASTVKEKLASKLNELYDAISDNEDIDAIVSSIEKLVAMNGEELIISDGFGYKDVNPEDGDWYVEHVLRASAGEGCKVMFKGDSNPDGTKKGTFRPGDPIARIEMLKVGLAASGNCLEGGTGDSWYVPYVEAGASAGLRIAKGHSVDDRGYWASPATREELAWLIYELGAYAEKYDLADADVDSYGFPDVDKNSELAKVAAILKKAGIITGTGEGLFNAKAQTNRAEASKVFTKFKESIGKSLF